MKRPESMPFALYRKSLERLNHKIDAHLQGTVIYRGKPFIAADNTLPAVKPLALAIRQAL